MLTKGRQFRLLTPDIKDAMVFSIAVFFYCLFIDLK